MKLLLLTALVCGQALLAAAKPKVICYWPNWRLYESGDNKHTPENIDPTLCTHLHYAFHVMDEQNNVLKDSDGPQPDIYRRLQELKKKNPELKIIPSLGGGGQPDAPYSRLVNDAGRRAQFIKNTIAYIHKYKWDGLDIDWEYPVCWGGDCNKGPKSDKPNFGKLLTELRAAFDKETPRLSLSCAIQADGDVADQAYDYHAMASATERFVSKGIPKEKVLMGVPFYGHVFKLQDRNQHSIGAPITGEGRTPHGEGDNAHYKEMCDLIKHQGWAKEDPDQGHDPISYHDLTWVGYDDPYAAYDKSKWVKDNGYGGIIVWEITQDDFHPKSLDYMNVMTYDLYGPWNRKTGHYSPYQKCIDYSQ
ncbi:unnamed protein product, partial [Medioppia subpectinata]